MKQYILSFLFISFLSAVNGYAQKQLVSVDTNYIQTLVDSCQTLKNNGDSKNAITVGQNLLALVELSLPKANNKTQRFLKISKASTLRNIGSAYINLSDLPNALDYYQQCLKLAKEIKDKVNIAGALLNASIVYDKLRKFEKALDYLNESVNMFREIGNKNGLALCFSNIGVVYSHINQDSLALEFYGESMNMYEAFDGKRGAATQLNNIAQIYKKQKKYTEALDNYAFSLKMYEEIGDSSGVASALAGMGEIYENAENNLKLAEKYYLRSVQNADLTLKKQILNALKDLYHQQGRYKEAFDMYDQFILIKDSIDTQQNADEITRREMQTDFDEKQTKLEAEKEKQAVVAAEEHKRQQLIIWSVAGGLLLVVIFSVFMFNRWRVTRKQKRIIEIQKTEVEHQKKLVEDHQKEIIDSITYAKRLQEAILPPQDFVKKHLPDSFILYKPKDIVAGDFYWMEVMDNIVFVAAADCTGHGVPGAMVSVVCCNALNRTVKEFGLRDTGKILDKVTELVLETFEKSDEEVKDGMDISLMAINKETNQIYWSGANNPLWYIQNNGLIDITADKQPIGKHDNRKPFTTHNIAYQPNTTFYLFTDGYADQFGGPKGKKFKYKQLEEKFLAVCEKPLAEQREFLENTFDEWKGKQEQVDDVSIIGISLCR